MKRYKAKFNPDSLNVFAVSLVEQPAMEGNFVAFQKNEEVLFKEVSKNRFMGLILEPDKEIYRNQNGVEFTISIPEEEVKKFAYNFQKQGFQNNSTLQHDGEPIKGVSFVETWLIENPEIDKSTNFGFHYPKGSWMGVMEFENEEVAKQYKEGKIKGFSIEAYMQLEEINLNNVNMSEIKEESLLNKISDAISLAFEKVGFKQAEKEEVKEIELEAKVEEDKEKVETKMEDAPVSNDAENLAKLMQDLIAKLTELMQPVSEEVVAMKKEIAEFKEENVNLKKEVEEISKQPATKIVKPAEQVDFSKMTEYQKYKYFKQNG